MIGKSSKTVLLTGAGWSRNWGGQLADELWESLIGHDVVQANSRLKDLLLNERSFEIALQRTKAPPFTAEDQQGLERAVLDAFISMDREIGRIDHDPWINIYGIQRFLFRFWGPRDEGTNEGYLFTLNQDLFFERYLYNEVAAGAGHGGALPGLAPSGQRWFNGNVGPFGPAFMMQPTLDPPSESRLSGQMNVIKLHGSFNWRSPGGENLMVIGTEKTALISSTPLLSWYAEVFKQVVSAGGVRLMIVGYGFGDEHINAVIAQAVEKHSLTVFIWNTSRDLKSVVLSAPYGPAIWKGLISTATRPLIEVFPSNQAETEEYRRISRSFFGKH